MPFGGIFGRPRTGGAQNEAAVNGENQLIVRAITEPDIEFVSEEGFAFTWSSSDAAAAAEESIYIENSDNLRELHISEVWCSGSADALWELVAVTSGTAAGTAITAKSMNRQFSVLPQGTFLGNAAVTGSVDGDVLMFKEALANIAINIAPVGGVILGIGNAIAVRQDATNNVNITVVGFYESKSV